MIVTCWITKSDVKTDLLFSHVIKAADNWNKKIWTWCWIISNPDLTAAWPQTPRLLLSEGDLGYNMMLLIYSKYGWGVYEQGQEQLKRVMESRLMSVSDRLSKCQLPFQCAHGRWVGLTEHGGWGRGSSGIKMVRILVRQLELNP